MTAIGKVLKPGGLFWIQTCTPQQVLSGMWWASLIPNAASRVAARFTAIPVFEQQLTVAGLSTISINIPEQTLTPMEQYLDMNAPFSEAFRKSDSTWALATEAELKAGLDWWKRMIESGQAAKALEDAEIVRKVIG